MRAETTVQLAEKSFLKPTQYYTAPLKIRKNSQKGLNHWRSELLNRGYRERSGDQQLLKSDFQGPSAEACSVLPNWSADWTGKCLVFRPSEKLSELIQTTPQGPIVIYEKDNLIESLFDKNTDSELESVMIDPVLFAQTIGEQPIMQSFKTLGEMPPACLNAVLAIEDSNFLKHGGFSVTSILRAIYQNTFGSGIKQGGSTITQQLVKNYFLSPEKTIRRKAKEFFLAIVLETIATKDLILETYLNIIYLGQSGTFQVRGFPAASQFYFQKDIESLDVHECSLLAAILNSPGLYDPFRKPENSIKRRNLVIDRMLSLGFISDSEAATAKESPLPTTKVTKVSETAPYFIQAVNRQLLDSAIPFLGATIYTTMDLSQQAYAQDSVNKGVESLLKNFPKLSEKGDQLQSMFLAIDKETAGVTALVGGRSYKGSQFNRAIQGHRQIGSLMKPFVYLTAFLENDETTPLTEIPDEKQSYKFDGQTWSPENYDKKFYDSVPLYFALKNSLNAATAALGMQVGPDKIIETARAVGMTSEFKPYPSLSLGVFELYASEVAQSYLTLSNFGKYQKISFVEAVKSPSGEFIFSRKPESEIRLPAEKVAPIIGMLRQTLLTGTAKWMKSQNFQSEIAGKTGTTSNHKDAWFAGFNPNLLAVAWVGFDDNTPTKLTGGSGPAPIWSMFIKSSEGFFPPSKFQWPEGVSVRESPDNRPQFDPPDYLVW